MNTNKLRMSDSKPLDNSTLFRQIIGSLIYLMVCTRPDICFSISLLSKFLEKPTKAHLEWTKHVLRYLSGTKSKCLVFKKSSDTKLSNIRHDFLENKETAMCGSFNL